MQTLESTQSFSNAFPQEHVEPSGVTLAWAPLIIIKHPEGGSNVAMESKFSTKSGIEPPSDVKMSQKLTVDPATVESGSLKDVADQVSAYLAAFSLVSLDNDTGKNAAEKMSG